MRRWLGLSLTILLVSACGTKPAPHKPQLHKPQPNAAPPQVRVNAPIGLAATGVSVWAVSSADGTVVRIDSSTGTVTAAVPVGDTPLRAAVDGDLLWVTVFRADKVVAVNTGTGTVVHETPVGAGAEGVAVGFGSIWVVSQDARQLTRLDETGHVLGHAALSGTPRLVEVGPHGVYVTDYDGGTVTRFDRTGAHPNTTGKLCAGAQAMAIEDGTIWLACTSGNQVVALDEKTLVVRSRVAVPGEPDGIRVVGGTVWIACATGPTLVGVTANPQAPAVTRTIRLGTGGALDDQANVDVESAGGKLWVSSFAGNVVYTILP